MTRAVSAVVALSFMGLVSGCGDPETPPGDGQGTAIEALTSGCGPTGFAVTGSMNSARSGARAVALPGGKVLVVGGGTTWYAGTPTDRNLVADVYDPAAGSFSTVTLRRGVTGASVTVLDGGAVLVAGGYDGAAGATTRAASIYDPATGTVADTGLLTRPRQAHTATKLADGKVLIAGGLTSPYGTASAGAELYDPVTRTFTTLPDMSTGRVNHTATLLKGGKVLLVSLLSSELYDPATRTFGSAAAPRQPRSRHTATRLTDGRVLLAGGDDQTGSYGTSEAELYEPATNTFTRLLSDGVAWPAMKRARHWHSATLLADGRVLVAGGADSTTELFDPRTGTFTWGPKLTRNRYGHTATLTTANRILVAGGEDGSIGLYTGAELSSDTSCSSVYQGCYVDAPTRALPRLLMSSGATVETCVAAALARGYAYAGLQSRGQCFAGDTLAYNRAYEADCNQPCDANGAQICGGPWRNSVYTTHSSPGTTPSLPPPTSALYLGCYVDAPARGLPTALMTGGATVESCIDAAAQQGLRYAGVQAAGQCFGGNVLRYDRAYELDCNQACAARPDEICGGAWRNSVYATSLPAPLPPPPPPPAPSLYLGCFADREPRALPTLLSDGAVTVEACIDSARQQRFRYAGLQAGFQCWAGNSLAYERAAESSCQTPCQGDAGEKCGGAWTNAIYATPDANPVVNPRFEDGLAGWTVSGSARTSLSPVHSGSYALQLGSFGPSGGASYATQRFTIPATATLLSFWYYAHCTFTATGINFLYVALNDETVGATYVVLPTVCSGESVWRPFSYAVGGLAGHVVTLVLLNNSDGLAPSYALLDDLVVR